MHLKNSICRICVFLVFCLAFFGCKKEDRNYSIRVTVLNAVPNSNGFRVEIGGKVLDSTLAYGIPEYDLVAPAATTTVRWKSRLSSGFDSSFTTDLPNGEQFTLLFYDSLGKYKSYFTRDVWKQPASAKQGYIRFFPMVINANQLAIANDTNKVLVSAQSFGGFTNSGASFVAVDSFRTKLRLYNNSKLLDSIPNAVLLPGKSYSIYAFGVLNGTGDKKPRMIMHQHE